MCSTATSLGQLPRIPGSGSLMIVVVPILFIDFFLNRRGGVKSKVFQTYSSLE